ncbi:MAG: hypothetical protein QGG09_03090, partial [Pirellulaceae bacterium]|nr:hypothetical protein [Pirellulaceae bacterium]
SMSQRTPPFSPTTFEVHAKNTTFTTRKPLIPCHTETTPVELDSIESLAEDAAANRSATPSPPVPAYSDQVYAMADSGTNAADIANHIGLPIGDVELVLSLRSQPGESL